MSSTSTRRAPHVFNLMRQMEVLERAGSSGESLVWDNAASVARAFQIGKFESMSVVNLQKNVAKPVVDSLRQAVRMRGMRGFLHHETVAKGVFNLAYSSGASSIPGAEVWSSQLTNKDDNELALLLVRRMCQDWDKLAPNMCKSWGLRESNQLHACCGGFLYFMGLLREKVPTKEYDDVASDLQKQFMMGSICTDIAERGKREVEERDRELADQVNTATLKQLQLKFEADLGVLKERVPTKEKEAQEAALDIKYLAQRQKTLVTGQDYTRDWLETSCKFIVVDSAMSSAVRALTSQISKLTEGGGRARIIEDHLMGAGLDVTQTVAVNFAQPQDARSSDRRSGIQTCIAVTGSGTRASLHWSPPALIGPLTLIKFTDLIGYDADVKKGLAVHNGIIDAYLNGLTRDPEDKVIVFDILPNRYAEFGRAVCERRLAGHTPFLSYMGLIKDSQKDNLAAVEEMVYNHWDGSSHAPAKQRPKEEKEKPSLSLVLWHNNRPIFPDALVRKFADGSDQHAQILRMKKELEDLWPSSAGGESAVVSARAAGSPDFTGTRVLDLSREVDLARTPSSEFKEDRLALCPGKANRPSILITKSFDIYLGNLNSEAMDVPCGELFGFNVGSFEMRIAPAGTDKSGPTLVPWRYDVKPDPSMSTNCFKPNSLASGFDHSAHKPSTLGCAFGGAMDKVQVQAGGSTPKVMPTKPKVYLTASVQIPPLTWVKL
ncbi:unnamed protein product [Durusdinium trenchii]|uniref:Uncharacterized protein n=2 Tax=Durusdinium trenchii TaxID=1381693 RepID=A0ABP0IMD4_9DINO